MVSRVYKCRGEFWRDFPSVACRCPSIIHTRAIGSDLGAVRCIWPWSKFHYYERGRYVFPECGSSRVTIKRRATFLPEIPATRKLTLHRRGIRDCRDAESSPCEIPRDAEMWCVRFSRKVTGYRPNIRRRTARHALGNIFAGESGARFRSHRPNRSANPTRLRFSNGSSFRLLLFQNGSRAGRFNALVELQGTSL